jgi:hypothetical protein
VLATAVVLLSGAASAFELSRVNNDPCNGADQNLFWPGSQALFTTRHLLEEPFQTAAEAAGARWNEAAAQFTYFLGEDSGFCVAEDGVITMGFLDTDCSGRAFGPNTLAVASTRFFLDGRIINGDIAYNSNMSSLNDLALFLETSIHELGHTLGLAHSDQCGGEGEGTVMKAVVSNTQRFDRPQPDDINGVNAIYGGAPVDTPTPTPTATPSPIEIGECVGDQDDDGAISSSEATRAVLAFTRRDLSMNPQADADSDGAVSSSEATRSVLQFIRRQCRRAS